MPWEFSMRSRKVKEEKSEGLEEEKEGTGLSDGDERGKRKRKNGFIYGTTRSSAVFTRSLYRE